MDDAIGSGNNSQLTGDLVNRGDGGGVYGLGNVGNYASLS